jgi:hypothetical protein
MKVICFTTPLPCPNNGDDDVHNNDNDDYDNDEGLHKRNKAGETGEEGNMSRKHE